MEGSVLSFLKAEWKVSDTFQLVKFMHFSFDLADITDKNNNVSFEGLDKYYHYYHSLSYGTRCDTSIMSISTF